MNVPGKFNRHCSSRSWDIVVTKSVRTNERMDERAPENTMPDDGKGIIKQKIKAYYYYSSNMTKTKYLFRKVFSHWTSPTTEGRTRRRRTWWFVLDWCLSSSPAECGSQCRRHCHDPSLQTSTVSSETDQSPISSSHNKQYWRWKLEKKQRVLCTR